MTVLLSTRLERGGSDFPSKYDLATRNTCRRVFLVYRSKPFIVARLLCCLFVDLIWRNLLYIPVERGDLIQSLPSR